MKIKLILTIAVTFLLLINISAQKRAFTISDLYKVNGVGSPVVSPNGMKIAYTLTRYNLPEGKTNTEINIMNIDGTDNKELDLTPASERDPVWDTKGEGLYFISAASGLYQLYYYKLGDDSAKQVTDLNMGINDPVLSPDGNLVAFSTDVYPECSTDENCNELNEESTEDGPVKAHMADKLFYRHWTDYSDGRVTHIFIYNIAEKKYTDVTPGEWESPTFNISGEVGFSFSPDSKELCFMSKRVAHPESSTNSDLWLVPVTGGTPINITAANEGWDGSPLYSPNGRYIAFKRQVTPGYESDIFRLTVYDRKAKSSKIITNAFDNWVDDFKWSSDSKELYFSGQEKGYKPVYKVNVESQKIEKVTGNRSIFGYELADGDKYLVYYASSINKPMEIYRLDLASKKEQELTFANKDFLNEVDVRPAEQIWIEGAGGIRVHVFIVKPHDFDSTKKYPLILNVHGGPQSQWMDSFRGDWQVYPGSGYIVAFANPHGSTGYGQAYTASISGDWGGKPFEDLMKVTDALEKLPYVDTARIGAMGWSYGGYMTNWFQAKTKRFKCLATMMGLYDLKSFYGTTEELWFPDWDLKGQPWNSDLYVKFSPSNYISNFATPTLIVTGERDYRVPYTQSVHYFTDLQAKGIDSRLIVFENDGHWPSNVKSMPVYYNAHLEWFHKYLGGAPAPYDTKMMLRNRTFGKGWSSKILLK